ncbi:hypothetical protein Z950_2207 [Sulfitobacter mediterraneus KCTC 32188]|nr:hypothetical protein Z950_2207 [Sulfitobacter mediterraneus KCTC 32188]
MTYSARGGNSRLFGTVHLGGSRPLEPLMPDQGLVFRTCRNSVNAAV